MATDFNAEIDESQDPRLEDPLNTDPILTAEINDQAARLDEATDPAFYSEDIQAMADTGDVSLREAQMWADYSQPATPEEQAALEDLGDVSDLAFVDDAADTDYILSLSTRGEGAMDRHLEDAVYGETEGEDRMLTATDATLGASFVGARRVNKGPLDRSRSLAKLTKVYRHLSRKAAINNGRQTPNAADKVAAKRVIADYVSRLSGMGAGLPTEILGADYGDSLGAAKAKAKGMTPARRKAVQQKAAERKAAQQKLRLARIEAAKKKAAERKAAQQRAQAAALAKRQAAQKAQADAQAKKKADRLSQMKAKREAAQKRRQAALLRAEAAKRRKIASSKPRPGTPTRSPLIVQPGRPGRAPAVVIQPEIAANPSPLIIRTAPGADNEDPSAEQLIVNAPAESDEAPDMATPEGDAADAPDQGPEEPTEEAPEMPATDEEVQTAEADADVAEAQAEATEAEAEASEAEASEEDVQPEDLSGDFIGAAPPEQTKVLRKAAEKSPTGAKIRAGMSVYRKVKAGDPKAKAAVAKMAVRAQKGDPQAKADLLSVKAGKVAQEQLIKAKRAFAVVKKAAARRKGFDLWSLLKTNSMKARDRYDNALKVQRRAMQGDPRATQTINTINKAAQTGDQGAIRAQKNLALAALVISHTVNPSMREQFDADFRLVKQARSALFGADARRQVATVAAAAKAGDKPATHRLEHFAIAAMILDMLSGRDYKVTPAMIAKAGGKLPAVPPTVRQAAAALVAAKRGNPAAKQKLANTAKAAMSGDLHAIKMLGDVALVGAIAAAKKGKPIHPNLKEASKIVAKAKQGDPKAKRTIARATNAAKKGDPKGVKAMVALTAANTAQKAGGIPVTVRSPSETAFDLLPLRSLPSPLKKAADSLGRLFSFYRDGVSSRVR
jgi:hypothetical protein